MPSTTTFYYSILFFLFAFGAMAQHDLKPTETQALVGFTFTNPLNQKAVPNKRFEIQSEKTKATYNVRTDSIGKVAILLPINQVYTIHLHNWQNFASFQLDQKTYQVHDIPVPFYEIPKEGSGIVIKIPVQISLVQSNGLPNKIIEKLTIKSGETRKTYTIKTQKNGVATIDLPINAAYMVSLEGAPYYYKFEIPNKPYAAWQETMRFERKKEMPKYPSVKNALFNFIFEDMQQKRCAGEQFWVQSTTTNQQYKGITNEWGVAQILAPIDDTYTLNESTNERFDTRKVYLEEGSDLIIETIIYQGLSTQQRADRQKLQDDLAAQRDAITLAEQEAMTRRMDSLELIYKDKAIDLLVKNDLPIPIKKRTFRIRKAVEGKAVAYQQQYKVNPQFFEEKEKPILSVLARLNTDWEGVAVVTDVTESMTPYLEEVLIWHALNLRQTAEGKSSGAAYLFFNDGDSKAASAKQIGRTGGLYGCEGLENDLPLVVQTMQQAIQNGLGGGEPPENDLEAVLHVQQKKAAVTEIILIADSYSNVRDMALLTQIEKPVRVILCGVDETNNFYKNLDADVNEQYLTIAHRTGGSLHTLKSDIWNLSEKKEGEIVHIGHSKYILKNRQFVRLL